MIEVKNLSKSFSAVKAVDDISFNIARGEVVGLLGPNGAGKTTTMRMLTGYLTADSGEAVIGGTSVMADPKAVKRKIGYLPENAPLYTDMVVEDYLSFMARAREVAEEDIPVAVDKMVQVCDLATHFKRTIGQLSKGFKQRVGLAATMIHDPDVLILDEPTTGLDPNQIAQIRKLIIELGKEKTVILSTHIMQEVQETCNRVMIISHGKLAADGQVESVIQKHSGQLEMSCTIKAPGDILSELTGSGFISRAERIQSADADGQAYKLFSDHHIGAELFGFAKDKGWTITEMATQKRNLESVFRELTATAG